MTDLKQINVNRILDDIKTRILNYYTEYEESLDRQIKEFDIIIERLTNINKERLSDVNDVKDNVISIVKTNNTVDSKIQQINTKFNNMYNKINEDYTTLLTLSNYDHLTTLLNRRQFDIQLESVCNSSDSCYLIMIDIDNFKLINDTYGHLIGDQVLKLISSIIKKICKSPHLSFRFGGEEFTIILSNVNSEKSFEIAESIRNTISKYPFVVKDDNGIIIHKDINITISLGITKIIENDTLYKCIERVDRSMNYSKKSGKNKTCIYEDLVNIIKKE